MYEIGIFFESTTNYLDRAQAFRVEDTFSFRVKSALIQLNALNV